MDDYPVLKDKPAKGDKVYVGETDADVLYAALGVAKGYQSQISVLVSLRTPKPAGFDLRDPGTYPPTGENPQIHRMVVVQSSETPGLGENIKLVEKDVSLWAKVAGHPEGEPRPPRFQQQFTDKTANELGDDERDPLGSIDAVTGATITSKAVVKAVRNAVRTIQDATAR
jgi:hypothetical protein